MSALGDTPGPAPLREAHTLFRPNSGPPAELSAGAAPLPNLAGYEILHEIARGGMGVVYKARQCNLNRTVALKMILSGQLAGPDEVRRFRTEAEAAAQLDHPGIVPVYETGEQNGQHFFTMGFVEGRSLAELVAVARPAPADAAVLARKVALAIAYAHAQGVVHRDLKPANILLDRQGEPKVADFGLAKQLGSESRLTGTGQALGTPSFMAPEQVAARTGEVGPAADVYAIGGILYFLLTGRPPFECSTPLDTMLQVLDQEPVPPHLLNRSVPLELSTICLQCLQKEPAARYAGATDVAEELQRYLDGVPIRARSDSAVSRVWRLLQQPTRHGNVIRRWGRVLMWIAGLLLPLFVATNLFVAAGLMNAGLYVGCWSAGLAAIGWAVWRFRFRDGEPLLVVERQVAQVWSAFFCVAVLTGVLNHVMGFPPLRLLPAAALMLSLAFAATAAVMGGSFYLPAFSTAVAALAMGLWPQIGPLTFGIVFSVSLFWPAWKYSRGEG